jgi:hypothetical protein
MEKSSGPWKFIFPSLVAVVLLFALTFSASAFAAPPIAPVKIPPAAAAGAGAGAAPAPPAPPAPPSDAPIDPCESGQLGQRVECVLQLSRSLAGVCNAPVAQRTAELQALKTTNAATDDTKIQRNICDVLCPSALLPGADDQVNLCGFNPILASAAAASAWGDILIVRNYVKAR